MDGKLTYTVWDDYESDFPDGRAFWRWVTHEGKSPLYLIKSDKPEHSFLLPGGYIHFHIVPAQIRTIVRDKFKWVNDGYRLVASDADDYSCEKEFTDEYDAATLLMELMELVPLNFSDLVDGYGFSHC